MPNDARAYLEEAKKAFAALEAAFNTGATFHTLEDLNGQVIYNLDCFYAEIIPSEDIRNV